jgi:hypothetical protein
MEIIPMRCDPAELHGRIPGIYAEMFEGPGSARRLQ